MILFSKIRSDVLFLILSVFLFNQLFSIVSLFVLCYGLISVMFEHFYEALWCTFGLKCAIQIVVVVVVAGLFFADILENYFGSPSLFSVMRLGRLFTLCGAFPHIRFARRIWILIMGFVMSLPALFNIGLLFFLIVYTFSIIGMFNFAYVKHEMMIDDMFNFKTFGNSIISMTMITTSSGWYGLLSPIMNTPPDCDLRLPEPGNCANPTVGIVFFSSYILLFCLLVIHLFIVVILELFNTTSPEDAEMLSDDHLQMFYETWRRFDPSGSQVIQYR